MSESYIRNRPIRVLFINHVGFLSGAEHSLLEILRAFDGAEVTPVVACPAQGDLARFVFKQGIRFLELPAARMRRSLHPVALGRGMQSWLRWNSRLVKTMRGGFDVVHANSATAFLLCSTAASAFKIPVIWHARDLRLPRGLALVCSWLADRIIAVSDAVRKRLVSYGVPEHKIVLCYNGIDAHAFSEKAQSGVLRNELNIACHTPMVVCVGQLVPWKGHRWLLESFKSVLKVVPDAQLAIVGADLYSEHGAYVEELVASCSEGILKGHVHFVGYRNEMASVYLDSNLVVVPSEEEPFGRIALEAMAVGRPVVGFDGGGLPEVVENGATGRLVPLGNTHALASAITDLLSNREACHAMGGQGKLRAARLFDSRQIARAIEAVYLELVSGQKVATGRSHVCLRARGADRL